MKFDSTDKIKKKDFFLLFTLDMKVKPLDISRRTGVYISTTFKKNISNGKESFMRL